MLFTEDRHNYPFDEIKIQGEFLHRQMFIYRDMSKILRWVYD